LAQAAHSGEERASTPNTEAPEPEAGALWLAAWARAALTGARVREARATEALSMIRLITMSAASGVTATGSAATCAIR
jgi:hypothetical protein